MFITDYWKVESNVFERQIIYVVGDNVNEALENFDTMMEELGISDYTVANILNMESSIISYNREAK